MTGGRGPLLLLSTLALASAGCHTYTPVQSPTPGQIVRIHVPLTSAIANPNAPPETVSIEGQVLAVADTIVVATRTRREVGAFREIVQYDTLRVDRDQLAGIELREFSTSRSIVLTAAILGGATAFALAALSIETGSTGEGDGGGGPVTSVVVRDIAGMVWGWLAGGGRGGR